MGYEGFYPGNIEDVECLAGILRENLETNRLDVESKASSLEQGAWGTEPDADGKTFMARFGFVPL
jgi:hypothetical protein